MLISAWLNNQVCSLAVSLCLVVCPANSSRLVFPAFPFHLLSSENPQSSAQSLLLCMVVGKSLTTLSWAIIGLALHVSYLAGITALCRPMPDHLETIVSYILPRFFVLSSSSKWQGKSSPCSPILVGRRHSFTFILSINN